MRDRTGEEGRSVYRSRSPPRGRILNKGGQLDPSWVDVVQIDVFVASERTGIQFDEDTRKGGWAVDIVSQDNDALPGILSSLYGPVITTSMTNSQPSLIRWCVGLPSLTKYNAEWMAIGEGLSRIEELYATFQSLKICHIWVLSTLFQDGVARRGDVDEGGLTQRVQTRISKVRELGVEGSLGVGSLPDQIRRLRDAQAKAKKRP